MDPRHFLEKVLTGGWTGFLTAALVAPLVLALLRRIGSKQDVSEHVPEHQKKQGTPTMGGLIIVIGVTASFIATGDWVSNGLSLFLFLWYAAIGFLDDFVVPRTMKGKRGLGWMPKLALEAVPFLYMALAVPYVPLWQTVMTAFVVLFMANAYNFCDGMDGLAGSVGVVMSLALLFLSLLLSPSPGGASLVPVLAGLTLSFLPFLFLNAPPAKVFMGDVGSLPIGALLGVAYVQGILFGRSLEPDWSAVIVTLPLLGLFLVELVPVPLQIASAKLRKGQRLFPFRTPVHHAFEAIGWPETRVTATFLLAQTVLAAIAISLAMTLLQPVSD